MRAEITADFSITMDIHEIYRTRILKFTRNAALGRVALGVFLCVSGCSGKPDKSVSTKVAPAKVEMVPHETELATLTLTADAVKRLAIQTVPVEKRDVSRHRTLAGEAIVPSGRSIIAAAPVPGVIAAVDNIFPQPGSKVVAAQPLMILQPLLSPERDVPTPAEQVQMTGAKAI